MSDPSIPDALTRAADTAGAAPSINNSQPWRWRVYPDRMELHAERSRQLTVADPDLRFLTLSCGAALHHARITLAAAGWQVRVEHCADPAGSGLLASLTLTGHTQPDETTVQLAKAIPLRVTDRRPVSDEPMPRQALMRIETAVTGMGRLHRLTPDQVLELASSAVRATGLQAVDARTRNELSYWTSRTNAEGIGLPPEVIPAEPPQTTVPARDFGRTGTLPIGPGHDRTAVYVVLYGDDDEPGDWLRGGEALSAAWLTATALGVTVTPLSVAVEVLDTRTTLRRILSGLGYPYLVMRLGLPDPQQPPPPRSPRLPAAQVIDTSPIGASGKPAGTNTKTGSARPGKPVGTS